MNKFKAAVRLRSRNQLTIPTKFVSALSLQEGDFIELFLEGNDVVGMRPARLVRLGTPEAERADAEAESDIAEGRTQAFETAGQAAEFLRDRAAQRKRLAAEDLLTIVLQSVASPNEATELLARAQEALAKQSSGD